MDSLLLEAYESLGKEHQESVLLHSRFAGPKSAKDVADAQKAGVPNKTQADTKYCIRLWEEWRTHRNSAASNETVPDDITKVLDVSFRFRG